MVEAEGVGIFCLLKTHNLLVLRDAEIAQYYTIVSNWNVSGTRANLVKTIPISPVSAVIRL